MKSLTGPVLARLVTLPVSVVCGLVVVRLLVTKLGPADYGLVSLLVSLQLLFPFLDLGLGAAVLNGAAKFSVSQKIEDLTQPLRVAAGICLGTSSFLLVIGLAAAFLGEWPFLLGVEGDDRVGVAVVAILAINLVARPLVLASTALIGLGFGTLVVGLQVVVPLTSIVVVALGWLLDGPIALFAISSIVGQVVLGLICLIILSRRVPFLFRSTGCKRGHVSGLAKLRMTAGPMLLINIVGPMGTNLDRIVLSHSSSPQELAVYALAAQLYQPVISVLAASQQPIWADFSKRRASREGQTEVYLKRLTGVLCVGGAFVAVAGAILSPAVGSLVSGDRIEIGVLVASAFALVVLMTAVQVPAGGLLTTSRGLWQQVVVVLAAVGMNLVLTVLLAGRVGALGAVGGTAAGALVIFVGTFLLAVRESKRMDMVSGASAS